MIRFECLHTLLKTNHRPEFYARILSDVSRLMPRVEDEVDREVVALNLERMARPQSDTDLLLASDSLGDFVGMLTLTDQPNFAGGRLLLGNFAISERYSRNGVGREMLSIAEKRARERGLIVICAEVSRAAESYVKEFYNRAGFERDASDGYHKYL